MTDDCGNGFPANSENIYVSITVLILIVANKSCVFIFSFLFIGENGKKSYETCLSIILEEKNGKSKINIDFQFLLLNWKLNGRITNGPITPSLWWKYADSFYPTLQLLVSLIILRFVSVNCHFRCVTNTWMRRNDSRQYGHRARVGLMENRYFRILGIGNLDCPETKTWSPTTRGSCCCLGLCFKM